MKTGDGSKVATIARAPHEDNDDGEITEEEEKPGISGEMISPENTEEGEAPEE